MNSFILFFKNFFKLKYKICTNTYLQKDVYIVKYKRFLFWTKLFNYDEVYRLLSEQGLKPDYKIHSYAVYFYNFENAEKALFFYVEHKKQKEKEIKRLSKIYTEDDFLIKDIIQ